MSSENGSDLALRLMHVEARQQSEFNRLTELEAKQAKQRELAELTREHHQATMSALGDLSVRLQQIDTRQKTMIARLEAMPIPKVRK
jgi:hypothetical protein